MIDVISYPDKLKLSEIFQSLDIKFALLSKDNEQVHAPAKCRDFLGDCLWSKQTENAVNIYNFRYNYITDKKFDDTKLKLSLKFPDGKSLNYFMKNLSYLHKKEAIAKVKKTKVCKTKDKDTLVVIASKYWMQHPWKLSLYTFYLKQISYLIPTNLQLPEKSYLEVLRNQGTEFFMLKQIKKKTNVWFDNVHDAHERSGFYTAITANNEVTKAIFGEFL